MEEPGKAPEGGPPKPPAYPSQEEEDVETRTIRHRSVKLLLEAGERLRLPQETVATAVVVFHRFFAQRSLSEYQARGRLDVLLTTCLFLAAKVEEHPRRLRDVINSVHYLRALGRLEDDDDDDDDDDDGKKAAAAVLDDDKAVEEAAVLKLDKEYWALKGRVVDTEQLVLRVLGFDVDTFMPYRLLLNYARSLRLRRATVAAAWTVLNDSLFSPRCQGLPPQAQACAALYLAQTSLGALRTEGKGEAAAGAGGPVGRGGTKEEDEREVACDEPMWRVLGAKPQDVLACCSDVLCLYERGLCLRGDGGEGGGGGGGARPPSPPKAAKPCGRSTLGL